MSFIKKHFHKILLLSCIILSLLNLINCWIFKIEYVFLSENQILYIYSSLAQVIGALLGLTIAGYSIVDSKLKTLSETDTTITEYVEDTRHDYYISLMYIIILSTINIILCLIVLAVYDNVFNLLAPFSMTETVIIFVYIMIELIRFVCYLNPNTIKEKGSLDKDSIDAEYKTKTVEGEPSENFSPFITDYNLLEKLLKDFACFLIESPNSTYKIQIFEALDVLLRNEIINRETYSIIDEFRRYRNALVHSLDTDKSVNTSIYRKLNDVYILLKSIYNARISGNDDEFKQKQHELMSYSKTHGYNEIDRKIIDFILTHPNTSLREISEYTNYTSESIRRRISNLQKIGAISKIGEGKQTRWQVNSNIL